MKLLRHEGVVVVVVGNKMLVLRVLGIWLWSQHHVIVETFYVCQ